MVPRILRNILSGVLILCAICLGVSLNRLYGKTSCVRQSGIERMFGTCISEVIQY